MKPGFLQMMFTHKQSSPFAPAAGAAAEGPDGGRDSCSNGGSGSDPPAAAAEQGPAAAPGPARAAAEGDGGPLRSNSTSRTARDTN